MRKREREREKERERERERERETQRKRETPILSAAGKAISPSSLILTKR